RILPLITYYTYGDPEGTYNIVTLYYESSDKKIYFETMNRLRFRQKLRLRVYDQADLSSNAFIEIKQKFGNVVNKRRTMIPLGEAYQVLEETYNERLIISVNASNTQIFCVFLQFKDIYNLLTENV